MAVFLSNEDIESVLSMPDVLEATRGAFTDLSDGRAVNRPRSHAYTPYEDGKFYNFKSMDGSIPRIHTHALRIVSEVQRETTEGHHRRDDRLPLPSGHRYLGMVLLFDTRTAELLAIMQESVLQRLRVGATSGLAAAALSRISSRTVGMLGTGAQAMPQLEALHLVRSIEHVSVYSPTRENRERFASAASERLGLTVEPVESPLEAVRDRDIVVCATNALTPVFDGQWLQPGQHVNSLQAGELDAVTHERADIVAIRSRQGSYFYVPENCQELPGEMREHDREATNGLQDKFVELGDLLTEKSPGRTDDEQITLFGGSGTGPSSGLGVQFAAVGRLALDECRRQGVGEPVPFAWFG